MKKGSDEWEYRKAYLCKSKEVFDAEFYTVYQVLDIVLLREGSKERADTLETMTFLDGIDFFLYLARF